jgi:hypothetical protein
VAKKRYKEMDHRGHFATLGHGWITGIQNRIPAAKKLARWV